MQSELSAASTSKAPSNFHLSFFFLPKKKKEAMFHFYQFCRLADDIVDECGDTPEGRAKADEDLRSLSQEVELAFSGNPRTQTGIQLKGLAQDFGISRNHCLDIIRGCRMDLEKNRYETFEELYDYCYCVASCVGLVSLSIFGCDEKSGQEYAVNLGMAFQITNILRDVREDLNRNRIYLPQEDLKRFAVTEAQLKDGKSDSHFLALMRFQCDRAQSFYQQSERSFPVNQGRNLIAAQIMKEVYFEIFKEVQQDPGRVLREKVSISKPRKIYLALLGFLSAAVRP